MKRDMKVIKQILEIAEKIEGNEEAKFGGWIDKDNEYCLAIIKHMPMAIEAGLIIGESRKQCDGPDLCKIKGITWAGRDLLDKLRIEIVENNN